MNADHKELVTLCGRSLDRVAGLIKPHDSDWLSLDLGMGQLKAMMILAANERLTVGGLARALNLSEPSTSLLVDKLVQRGLALRETDPADRRRTLVLASPDGVALVGRLQRTRQDRLMGWLEQMHEADIRALTQGLDAFAAAIVSEGEAR